MGYSWSPSSIRSPLPKDAILAGRDTDKSQIYVGRALFSGHRLPAKVIPSKKACYVSFNGLEHSVQDFEVLIGKADKFTWEAASNGQVPENAISSDKVNNEDLFVGRAPFEGSVTVGKVHPSHSCLYIPFGGKEHSIRHYEVLVYKKPKTQWVSTTSRAALPNNAVPAGRDTDGSPIYVGRSAHGADLIPAKVIPSKQVAYIPFGGVEIAKHSFEILIGGDVKWSKEKDGKLPKKAIVGGKTSTGEALYIGRANHEKSVTVGKIQPSHKCLYIPYGGKEVAIKEYEVLVEK